jgi:hypothetical protein
MSSRQHLINDTKIKPLKEYITDIETLNNMLILEIRVTNDCFNNDTRGLVGGFNPVLPSIS